MRSEAKKKATAHKRSGEIVVPVKLPNGKRVRVRISKGGTIGSIRRAIARFIDPSIGKKKGMKLTDIALVNGLGQNIASSARTFIYNNHHLLREWELSAMRLTDYNNGNSQNNTVGNTDADQNDDEEEIEASDDEHDVESDDDDHDQ